jgi:hypothetical protein
MRGHAGESVSLRLVNGEILMTFVLQPWQLLFAILSGRARAENSRMS